MIHEYALEPELVATWTDRTALRHVRNSFGGDKGRIVSRYPKKWKKFVWEAYEGTSKEKTPIEQERMIEIIKELSPRIRRRSSSLDPERTWLQNAEKEHERIPFWAVVSRENPRKLPHVITEKELNDEKPELWEIPTSRTVARDSTAMAEALSPMLRCSMKIVFVDPYFDPAAPRFVGPFKAFLERMVDQRPVQEPPHVCFIASCETQKLSAAYFQAGCKKLASKIPRGLSVTFIRLANKEGGKALHNRYVLTDLGGVVVGTGLDQSHSPHSLDDISIMGAEQYRDRWEKYFTDRSSHFVIDEPRVDVLGTRKR